MGGEGSLFSFCLCGTCSDFVTPDRYSAVGHHSSRAHSWVFDSHSTAEAAAAASRFSSGHRSDKWLGITTLGQPVRHNQLHGQPHCCRLSAQSTDPDEKRKCSETLTSRGSYPSSIPLAASLCRYGTRRWMNQEPWRILIFNVMRRFAMVTSRGLPMRISNPPFWKSWGPMLAQHTFSALLIPRRHLASSFPS